MREIPQRELRNNVAAVLREVESGTSLRVTVRGRPVADIVPLAARKQGLSPEEVMQILAEAPLDAGFVDDLDAAAGARIDEL
jgi:prevent-host-death family protein